MRCRFNQFSQRDRDYDARNVRDQLNNFQCLINKEGQNVDIHWKPYAKHKGRQIRM